MKFPIEVPKATLAEILAATTFLIALPSGVVKRVDYSDLISKLNQDLNVSGGGGEATLTGTAINLTTLTTQVIKQSITSNTTYTINSAVTNLAGKTFYFYIKNTHATNTVSVSFDGTNNLYFPASRTMYVEPGKTAIVSFIVVDGKIAIGSTLEI